MALRPSRAVGEGEGEGGSAGCCNHRGACEAFRTLTPRPLPVGEGAGPSDPLAPIGGEGEGEGDPPATNRRGACGPSDPHPPPSPAVREREPETRRLRGGLLSTHEARPRARRHLRVPGVERPSGLRRMWPHSAALPLTRGRSRALLAMCPPPRVGALRVPRLVRGGHEGPAVRGPREEQRGSPEQRLQRDVRTGGSPECSRLAASSSSGGTSRPPTAFGDRHARRAIAEREEPGTKNTNQ